MAGEVISRSNMQSIFGSGSWTNQYDYSNPNNTYWIAAAVITVQLTTNASGLASNRGSITVYKWDGPGTTSFTQYSSGSTRGGWGASDNTWRFVHNCSESYNSRDISNIHLWKFVVSTSGGGTKTFSVRAGGVHSSLNNNPDTYAPGNLIRGCKPDYWASGGTYSSDEAFVSREGPQAHTGTIIDHTNGYYCYGEY